MKDDHGSMPKGDRDAMSAPREPIRIVIKDSQAGERLRALLGYASALELSIEADHGEPPVDRTSATAGASGSAALGRQRRLQVKQDGGTVLYRRYDDIDWCEAANQYVKLHFDQETHLIRASLRQLESELDPRQFQRIHRSAIVNLASVVGVQTASPTQHWAVLRNGARLPVSQSFWPILDHALLWAP